MLVGELEEGMLLEAAENFAIVYCGQRWSGRRSIRSAPDVLAPGFDGHAMLDGGTWMYLGSKRISHDFNYGQSKPGLRKVHELFHSRGGIFVTTGQIFKDLKPLEIR